MTTQLRKDSPLPPYMAYPRFLLEMDFSETTKLVYVLLLDRTRLSMQNDGWTDEQGHVYVNYTIGSLAKAIGKSEMTVKNSLHDLEQQGLIHRQHQGLGRPSKIFVRVQTENCLPERQDSVRKADRILSRNNNKRTNQRNYDFAEGESL